MTEENGNVNSPFSFEDCFLLPCAVVSTGIREWVTLGKFECLIGVYFVLGNVCTWREGEERLSESFSFSFKQLHFCLFQFRRDRREGIVLRKLLTCRLEETTPFGDHFPPKSPTRHRFGNLYFPPKAHTTPFWGPTFPPNFPRWTGLLSFFLFWFLSYFGLV